MKRTSRAAMVGLLSVLLPSAVHATPAPPARILMTLQVVEIPSRISHGTAPAPYPTTGIYDAPLKEGDEATEISVQAPNDFPGVARYSRVFAFTTVDHGKPGRGFLTAPTSLEATPHLNSDGTITVDLKTEVTRVAPAVAGAVPMTMSQSMTTRRTFKSGQTIAFSGTSGAWPDAKWLIQFVTVTVLPSVATR